MTKITTFSSRDQGVLEKNNYEKWNKTKLFDLHQA